jgi:streptogramin lyase
MRVLAAAVIAFASVSVFLGCQRAPAQGAAAAPTPAPPPLPGTEPIPLVTASPLPLTSTAAAPASAAAVPVALRGVKFEAAASGVAYAVSVKQLQAIDVTSGAVRWTAPDPVDAGTVTAGDRLVFGATPSGQTSSAYAGFRVADGRRIVTIPDVYRGWIVDGILYANGRQGFSAYDAATGLRIWRSLGAGASLGQEPVLIGTALLQNFWDSGATMVDSIYAFDVRNGRLMWTRYNGPHPIGYGNGVIYMNTTWCGSMASCFHSLDVDAVDLASGVSRTHASYVLDDLTDGAPGESLVAAAEPHVTGGYVYFGLHGRWYRYDVDRDPAHGHGVRLEGLIPRAWFDDGAALATHGDALVIARSYPDRVELALIAAGPLRSPVVAAADGTRYAVSGENLIAVEPSARRARIVGQVGCETIPAIVPWQSRVTVRCTSRDARGGERLITFDDLRQTRPTSAPVAAARPAVPPLQSFTPRVHLFDAALPERTDVVSAALTPDGSLAFVLARRPLEPSDAVGRMTRAGAVEIVPLPVASDPPEPRAVAVDRHGTVWFNDSRHATVSSLDAARHFTTYLIGESRASGPRTRSLPGIRIAVGGDGEAWFARSLPTPQIGRIAGGPRYDVPAEIGSIAAILPAPDGSFWFVTDTQLGRMTPAGRFTHAPLPVKIVGTNNEGNRVFATGPSGTVWLSDGKQIVQSDGARILRTIAFPGATTTANDLVTGCDGSLYIAENLPQVGHVANDGRLEEYPIDGLNAVRTLLLAPDCRIWINGYGNGRPVPALFELVKARPG